MRQLRAVVLIGAALTAVAVVSLGYLHPPSHPAAAQGGTSSRTPAAVVQTQGPTFQHFNMSGPIDGGYYFTWVRDNGSSGGHATT